MKKNDVFTFIAPNGVEGTAVVVAFISSSRYQTVALCYAQNRLFTFYEHIAYDVESGKAESDYSYGEILVDYAVLPDYDDILERYKEKLKLKVECDMEHSREAIRTFIAWGFSEEEAINILDGKNPDGTEFIELPF